MVGADKNGMLYAARDYVNVMLDKNFLWDDVVELVKLLKKRHTTFQHVLDTDGVH